MRDNRKGPAKDRGPRINDDIRIPECRLVGEDEQYGVVTMARAKEIADGLGLDLVEVSPTAKPPVVKVIDYGKYRYEIQKKAAEAKKKQVKVTLKEIQLRPNIEKHDLDTKLKKVKGFLADGDKVKFVMQFRGREMAYRDAGFEKFNVIISSVIEDFGAIVESPAKMMGNRIITILASSKKN